ncbi:hypothetical protein F4779DRAFT_620230 [Xylariaceae sp. FL0662B]|nr:hypothetical protein F4779DRAFT_620230 [Xylariaceae sp. FL0662B]
MPQHKSFHLFRALPTELRLQIWGEFALPKTPFVHDVLSNWRRFPSEWIMATAIMMGCPNFDPVRCIMQANREGRQAVLNGREPVVLPYVLSDPLVTVPYPRVVRLGHRQRDLGRLLFVNWEKDVFHFNSALGNHTPLSQYPRFVGAARNIAFDLAPRCSFEMSRDEMCIQAGADWYPLACVQLLDDLSSFHYTALKKVLFVLNWAQVHPRDSILYPPGSLSSLRDEFGFHPVVPDMKNFGPFTKVTNERDPGKPSISFQSWAAIIESNALEITAPHYGRPLEVRVVMAV